MNVRTLLYATTVWIVTFFSPAYGQGIDLSCRSLAEIEDAIIPPRLVQIIRTCLREDQFDYAVEVFVGYNSHLLFDQQRVADETAHVVVQELNTLLLEGLSSDEMSAMRDRLSAFKTQGSATHVAICEAMAERGKPNYKPDYMIYKAANPLKSDQDWRTEAFDPDVAWRRATVELNGCRVDG